MKVFLLDEANGLLPDDKLTLFCEVGTFLFKELSVWLYLVVKQKYALICALLNQLTGIIGKVLYKYSKVSWQGLRNQYSSQPEKVYR